MPAVKVSQRPLTVQDAVCYLKPSGGGVDSQVEPADPCSEQLITWACLGVDSRIHQVLDGGGGLEAHGGVV